MNKKKLIAILTLVGFMFTLVPVAAMAEENTATVIDSGTCGESATWLLTQDGSEYILTISGSGALTDFDKVSNVPWYKYIKNSSDTKITSIVVEEGITHIGDHALQYGGTYEDAKCNVASITLPSTLKSIGDYGIAGFEEVTSITLPESLEKIGEKAFSGLKLSSITLGKNLIEIGEGAFSGVASISVDSENTEYLAENGVLFNKDKTALMLYPTGMTSENYTIPDSVVKIGSNAFAGNTSLKSLVIGLSVTDIGDGAFSDLALESLNVVEGNNHFVSDSGVLYTSEKATLIYYPSNKQGDTFAVPNTVTTIAATAFRGNQNIQKVELLSGVTTIGNNAFSACNSLTAVVLPDTIKKIDSSAFASCESLQNLLIPRSVESIGAWAFTNLKNDSVIFTETADVLALIRDSSYECYTKSKTALASLNGGTITQAVTPNNLISTTPTKSGYLFDGWYTDVELENEATETVVGKDYYAAWTTVRMTDESVDIAVGATEQLSVETDSAVTESLQWTSSNDAVASVDQDGIVTGVSAGMATITVSCGNDSDSCEVTVREEGIALEETNIELILQDTTKLNVVLTGITDTITWTSSNASIVSVSDDGTITANALGKATITAAVGSYSDTCEVKVVDGGSCGTNATWRYDAENKTLTISGIGATTGYQNPEKDEYTNIPPWYKNYHELIEKIVVEEGITALNAQFARNCTKLEEVQLPTTLTTLGNYAFSGCSSLTGIDLPESITKINQQCFYNTGLTKLIIPENVTTLGKLVCGNNGNLTAVYMKGTVGTVGDNVFSNLAANSVIYVKENAMVEKLAGKYTTTKTTVVTLNGGTIDIVASADETTGLITPTRTGYEFGGWYTTENCTEGKLENKAQSGTTYYAKWTLQSDYLELTFNANDGTDSPATIEKTVKKDSALPKDLFTRAGYTFDGWNTQADGQGSDYVNAGTGDTVAATLYAQWILNVLIIETATGDVSKTYNGEAVELSVTANHAANDVTLSYQWTKGEDDTVLSTESSFTIDGDVADSGTYTCVVTAADTDGKNATAEKKINVTITNAKISDITVTGYSGVYDNAEHTITYTVPTDATIRFAETAGTTESAYEWTTPMSYKNVGTYPVHYQVTMDNYTPVWGSVMIEITKATQVIDYAVKAINKVMGDAAFTNALNETTVYGDISYSSSNTDVATVASDGEVTIKGAGTATITAAAAGSDNYDAATASYTVTVEEAIVLETDKRLTFGAIEVNDSLKAAGFNNEEEVYSELYRVLADSTEDELEETEIYDVKLQLRIGGTWVDATEDDFPAEGITVVLPYPAETAKDTHDFFVTHMFTVNSDRLGTVAGEIETPDVTKKEDGIQVTLNGLSPVAIAWKEVQTASISTSGGGFSGKYNYPVTVTEPANGEAKADKFNAVEGATVTITTKAEAGYGVYEVIVTDADGDRIPTTDLNNGQYTFVMPDGEVNIEVVCKPAITMVIDSVYINVFGKTIKNDVAPKIVDNRTVLPIRVVAENLGADVDWDPAAQKVTITKGDTVIELFIGKYFAYVNGEVVELDVAPFIENDRTYLPVRFVSEYLGAMINWDAATRTVTIILE